MARGKTIYIKSQSGRVENFDQFAERIKKLSTSETLRFRELRAILKKEAQPLVAKARQFAYTESTSAKKSRIKTRENKTVQRSEMKEKGGFYNLYGSIGAFANKGDVKAYVVTGVRGKDKDGAYYANWQLFGGARPGRKKKGMKISQHRRGLANYSGSGFVAKKFFDKAVSATDVPMKAQRRMTKFVQKRIEEHLR